MTPNPWKKAYLNLQEEQAYRRFLEEHPQARDVSAVTIRFDDELVIDTRGDMSAYERFVGINRQR